MTAFPPSTDQVITLLAVVEHGNFSAAAKAMKRTQSSVTYAIQKLEADLGVALFDRSARLPSLTPEGRALIPVARRLASELGTIQRMADGMAMGLERKLLLAVDCVFPKVQLVGVLKKFNARYPTVRARIAVESMHAVAESIISGASMLGIVGPVVERYPDLAFSPVCDIERVAVAAPDHPLARWGGPIPPEEFREHIQFVLSNRSGQPRHRTFNSPVSVIWRMNDIGVKHAAILDGLGWGRLPYHLSRDDLDTGRLVRLQAKRVEGVDWSRPLAMHVAYRRNEILGPAASWMRDMLIESAAGSRLA